MKKSIKIQVTESGKKYFTIYEVRAMKVEDGSRIVSDRFMSRKEAEKYVEFINENYKRLYSSAWIMEEIVWC